MTANACFQIGFYLTVLLLLVKPLGWYMSQVLQGRHCGLSRWIGPIERSIYRCAGANPQREMNWKTYALAMLTLNALGIGFVYGVLRWQGYLPLNPQEVRGCSPDLAFNTAISFATNTNWQSYGGEVSLSYFSQMVALTVQNFISAASGIAVLAALVRGLARRETEAIGNFWVDVTRTTLYVLLPLSVAVALMLVSQGVVQNFHPYQTTQGLSAGVSPLPSNDAVEHGAIRDRQNLLKSKSPLPPAPLSNEARGNEVVQTLAMGPVASQVAIKQLGTNGGGFFNTNSAHPFENPTPCPTSCNCWRSSSSPQLCVGPSGT